MAEGPAIHQLRGLTRQIKDLDRKRRRVEPLDCGFHL